MSAHPAEPHVIACACASVDRLNALRRAASELSALIASAEETQLGAPDRAVVMARGPIFIGIDVMGAGIKITLWRRRERNAMYRVLDKDAALAKALPQVIDEALEFARQEECASGQFVTV
jgi:hypothetical protein